MAVDDARAAAALGDRGDDERLADPRVAGGEDAVVRRLVGRRLDVAAAVEIERELLDRARVLGVREADRDEHEVGGQLERPSRAPARGRAAA